MKKNNSRPVFIIFLLLCPLLSFCQQSAKDQLILPSIIVIPYTNEDQDIRKILEADDNLMVAITKVKEAFSARNFTTVDFVGKMKQMMDQKLFRSDNLSDIKTELINFSGADIWVEVKVIPVLGTEYNKARILLQAYDVSSAYSLANQECVSNSNVTKDMGGLISSAMAKDYPLPPDSTTKEPVYLPCREIFLNTLQSNMNQLRKDGRPMNMIITISPNSKYDMDYKVSASGTVLSEAIDEWMEKNTTSFNVGGETSQLRNYDVVRIPYRDPAGKQIQVGSWALGLSKYLQTIGVAASRDIKRGIISITIK